MPELVCELIVSLDGFAKGQRSPGYFGYFGPEFADWINTNAAPFRIGSSSDAGPTSFWRNCPPRRGTKAGRR